MQRELHRSFASLRMTGELHGSFASLRMTKSPRVGRLPLDVLHEAQRRRVHAVAEIRWCGAVVEDMSQVCVAFGASDRGAFHTKSCVGDLGNVFLGDGLPEAGPSSARLE